ncbi:MAG: hypothetical protein COA99_05955, partial [Moraxellaceae bacterium]
WALLQEALTNISTPYTEEHPLYDEFPHSKYYESALIAHQVYFAEHGNKFETLWERDNLQLDQRQHLKLNDLQAALGVDLRATIRELIRHTGNDLADFLQGNYAEHGKDWLRNLTAQLDDTWSFTEAPNDLLEDEDCAQQKQYRHTRWEKLGNILGKLADHPASQCQLIDGTPAIRDEVAKGKQQDPGYRLIQDILNGNHPLSPITLNRPAVLNYAYQEALLAIFDQQKDGGSSDPDRMTTLLKQINTLKSQDDATEDTKKEAAKQGLVPSGLEEVSKRTIKWLCFVVGQLFVGSQALSMKNVDGNNINGDIEKFRWLLNSVINADLNYGSFDDLIQLQNDTAAGNKTKQMIIAKALTELDEHKKHAKETSTATSPEVKEKQLQAEGENKKESLTQQNKTTRNDLKRIDGPKAIDKKIKQLNADLNKNRSTLAQSNDDIKKTINNKEARLRKIHHAEGESAVHSSALDPEIKQLQHLEDTAIAKKTQALAFKESADNQVKNLENLKGELEASRVRKTTVIEDKSTLLANVDKNHPLFSLKQLDDEYLTAIKNIDNDVSNASKNYQARFEKNRAEQLNAEKLGNTVVYTNTAEGQELDAFLKQQRAKLTTITDDPISVKYTNNGDFERIRNDYANKPNVIVFTPAQSKSMNTVQKGSYIVVGEEGKHIYQGNDAQALESRQHGSVFVSSATLVFDIWNMQQLLSNWKDSDNLLEHTRNLTQLLNSVTLTGASIGNVWKQTYQAKQVSAQASSTTSLSHTFDNSKLLNVGILRVLPIIAAVSGIAVSAYDGIQALMRGDDVAKAHAVLLISGIAGLAGLYYGGLAAIILGPVGLAIAVIGVALQFFVFKEDNLLNTWLERGPFSENKSKNHPQFQAISIAGWQHPREVSDSLKQKMGIHHHSVWLGGVSIGKATTLKDDKYFRKVLSLAITRHNIQLILDQNYQLLGYRRQGPKQDSSSVVFNDLTGDISVVEHGAKYKIGRIGDTLGSNSWNIIDNLVDTLPSFTQADQMSDTSVRFDHTGDEDKFTEPMRLYPAASLELLLNGLYPLKATFELMPVDKTFVKRIPGRSGGSIYDKSGNRAKVVVDLPYFIEGKSTLEIEIRVARDSDKQDRTNLPVINFNEKDSMKISSLSDLPPYNGDNEAGNYINHTQSVQQLIIITNFSSSSFTGDTSEPKVVQKNKTIDLECWVKLRVTSPDKTKNETVSMPWKGNKYWLNINPTTEFKQKAWLTMQAEDTLRG